MEDIKNLNYGEAMSRLEAILTEMRDGNCDIDSLSEKTATALALLKHCKNKLFKTDEEVKKCLSELAAE
ncbi:MAG: exodeoxyribonuclease VII small subunit [Bacteroidales bacterium]|nr:exodeoxyribonuclease VII small subunit [Bacteroidales bacterium]